jgi:hypothetical protein
MQLAEELGLSAQTQEVKDLNTIDVARGIGRKATNEELINYLNKDLDEEAIPLDKAFSKYTQ